MASGAIERYLLEFNEALVAGGERRERILAEVEDHLRDATDSLVAAGSKARRRRGRGGGAIRLPGRGRRALRPRSARPRPAGIALV